MGARGLDKRITLLKPVVSKGTAGQEVVVFEAEFSTWAERLPRGMAERWLGSSRVAEASDTWRINWRDDFDDTYRVEYSGQEYHIEGPPEDKRIDGARFLLVVTRGPVRS